MFKKMCNSLQSAGIKAYKTQVVMEPQGLVR